MGEQSVVPPADLARRVEQAERRQDRLEGEVASRVQSVDGLSDKLSGFLREYNQRSRTDWKTIIALIGALGTIGTAAIGGAIWIIMTIEGGREERLLAVLASLRDSQAAASSRQADVDGRIIEDYRREADALSGRLSRLEAAHMRGPDR